MSLRVLTQVWDRFPSGGSELLTMLALADWAGDDGGRIYPSKATIAAKIRMSERQVVRIMAKLESDGWIKSLAPNAGGRGSTTRYQIELKTLTNCPVIRAAGPVDNFSETLTNCPETLTPMSVNSDIAMSDKPLQPLYNRKEPEPIAAQRSFLKSLREMPGATDDLIAEAEHNLEQLIAAHNPQADLLENPKT